MVERTDGRGRDTGDGPKPITVVSGIIREGKAQAAYRVYLDHARDCEDCPRSPFQCEQAAALWQAYLEVRGQRERDTGR